jgi:hypothetical protein
MIELELAHLMFLAALGFELRAHVCQTGILQREQLHQPFFALAIFEIGCLELLTGNGFKPQSSSPLSPE